jgi:hypothetical protein
MSTQVDTTMYQESICTKSTRVEAWENRNERPKVLSLFPSRSFDFWSLVSILPRLNSCRLCTYGLLVHMIPLCTKSPYVQSRQELRRGRIETSDQKSKLRDGNSLYMCLSFREGLPGILLSSISGVRTVTWDPIKLSLLLK